MNIGECMEYAQKLCDAKSSSERIEARKELRAAIAATVKAETERLTRELAEAKARAIPNGWVAVPARLTAENGAKGALIGEFYEVSEHECTACDEIDEDETCDVCEGSGIVVEKVAVSWSTIKEIHSRVVALFARPELPKESENE